MTLGLAWESGALKNHSLDWMNTSLETHGQCFACSCELHLGLNQVPFRKGSTTRKEDNEAIHMWNNGHM